MEKIYIPVYVSSPIYLWKNEYRAEIWLIPNGCKPPPEAPPEAKKEEEEEDWV